MPLPLMPDRYICHACVQAAAAQAGASVMGQLLGWRTDMLTELGQRNDALSQRKRVGGCGQGSLLVRQGFQQHAGCQMELHAWPHPSTTRQMQYV
jgi:hypothetical protein